MRSFKRSLVLCALGLALTPAPAQAWFEWLDYLSGPGPFWGLKINLRLWCSGAPAPWKGLRYSVDNAMRTTLIDPKTALVPGSSPWEAIFQRLKDSNQVLPLIDPARLDGEIKALNAALLSTQSEGATRASIEQTVLKAGEDLHRVIDTFERAATSIAATGIFVSLCQNDKVRSLAVELDFTTLWAGGRPAYAGNHSIQLNTLSAALSYRFPLPPDRDIIDIGTSAGMYVFSSGGFDTFSGMILEPVFVDLHGPTNLLEAGGLKKFLGLFIFRFSLVMFPGGFDGTQFASAPSKPAQISGREVTPSATVYFNLTPLLWRRPASTISKPGAVTP